MRIKIGYLLVFFLLTDVIQVAAQEKLLLMNGKELLVQSKSLKEDSIRLEFKDYLSGKKKRVKKENVFSIKNEKGQEKIFYREDSSSFNNDLSLAEMRSYILGLQEAKLYFKAPFATLGGFLIGAGSGYYLYFYSLIPPGTYIAIIGNHQPDMKLQKVSDPQLLKNAMFVNGYQKKCNEIKVRNSAIGSLAGILAGVLMHQLLK